MHSRSALIVGAGIAGLAGALTLSRAGWRVTLLERATSLRGGAYVVGFSGIGYRAAERLGLLPALRARESPWREAQQVDRDGRVRSILSVDAQRGLVGRQVISILRGDLERCLHDALDHSDPEIDLRFASTVTQIVSGPDQVTATLADGDSITADLLIGADGQHSAVRKMIFGPEQPFRYDFGAEVVSFSLTDPPGELADRTTFFVDVDRGAGIYPQRDGDLAAFFTFAGDTVATGVGDSAADSLRGAYADLGWVWPEVLDRAEAAESVFFDSISQIRMPAWSRGRVVLLGDSAWAVSLLAGQGSSLAVGGAEQLAQHLARTADIGAALADWERRLRPSVLRLQWLGRRSRQLFIPTNTVAVGARHLAMSVAARPLVSAALSRRGRLRP